MISKILNGHQYLTIIRHFNIMNVSKVLFLLIGVTVTTMLAIPLGTTMTPFRNRVIQSNDYPKQRLTNPESRLIHVPSHIHLLPFPLNPVEITGENCKKCELSNLDIPKNILQNSIGPQPPDTFPSVLHEHYGVVTPTVDDNFEHSPLLHTNSMVQDHINTAVDQDKVSDKESFEHSNLYHIAEFTTLPSPQNLQDQFPNSADAPADRPLEYEPIDIPESSAHIDYNPVEEIETPTNIPCDPTMKPDIELIAKPNDAGSPCLSSLNKIGSNCNGTNSYIVTDTSNLLKINDQPPPFKELIIPQIPINNDKVEIVNIIIPASQISASLPKLCAVNIVDEQICKVYTKMFSHKH